ncbi:MAG: carboxylating nicotinate-nucleotide diphosphorylase [Pseudomonadota bacterium]
MSASTSVAAPPILLVEETVRIALLEDLGRAGDVTSAATVAPDAHAEAVIASREPGALCGIDAAICAFQLQRAGLSVEIHAADGARVAPGDRIASISGNARALLAGERVALNFLCHLSGIATTTAAYVSRVAHTNARIVCTRKTTPGLRALEKHAVRAGGGSNHRYGLDDAILIKDNHIAVCGGVAKAVTAAQAYAGHLVSIEVEVDTLEQFEEALHAGAKIVLLDNFSADQLREAVALNAGRAVLEASGGISLDTVAAVAETGVDFISSSKITISAETLDLGLDINIK